MKIKHCLLSTLLICASSTYAADLSGKKVLFVDSYHQGYAWSDGIEKGIKDTLANTGVTLEIVRMDTKRKKDEPSIIEAAKTVKSAIEKMQPDIVIAADDNASKYLVEPYYKNTDLPFVFAGVNWDASVYGYPYDNATGMVEVAPIPELLEQLKNFANGDKVGFIGPDNLTSHKEAKNYKTSFDLEVDAYFAKDADDWMKGFKDLQSRVDMLIIDTDSGVYADRADELVSFVEKNTKIPTGTCYNFMAPYAMLGFTKVAEEQGSWAASTALKILNGQSASDIPISRNETGSLIINTKIAAALNAELPQSYLDAADLILE